MPKAKKIKVLMAKAGLDGHDRGVLIVSLALRDAGMEVIYAGIYQTTDAIVKTAVQEDVDVVGISSLDGGHMTIFKEILDGLKKEERPDIMLIAGGVIPLDETHELKKMGVAEVLRAGTITKDVVTFIKENVH